MVGAARAAGLTDLADHLGGEIATHRREGASPFEAATKLMRAGDAPRARAAFEQVVAADPTNVAAWLSLADCRQSMDDLTGAEEALSHAAGSSDPLILAQAAMVAGTIASNRQRPRDAAARFAEAQRLDPRISKAYVRRGQRALRHPGPHRRHRALHAAAWPPCRATRRDDGDAFAVGRRRTVGFSSRRGRAAACCELR